MYLTHEDRLLGAHVLRRAKRQARLRHACATGLLHGECDTDIRDEGMPTVQQDVLRLDVAVDHPETVRVTQRVGHLTGNANGRIDGQLPLAVEARAQRFTGHQRHHVVQQRIRFTGIEQRQDMRVLQLGSRAHFAEEAFAAERHPEVGVEHLDGDVPLMAEIVREADGGHAALTQLAFKAVAVAQRRERRSKTVTGCIAGQSTGRARARECTRRR